MPTTLQMNKLLSIKTFTFYGASILNLNMVGQMFTYYNVELC